MTHGRNMSIDAATITSPGVDPSAPDRPMRDSDSLTSSPPLRGNSITAGSVLRHQQSSTTPFPSAQSPTARASMTSPPSNHSHSQSGAHSTQTDLPSGTGSPNDTEKGSPSNTAATTPTTGTSPKEKAAAFEGVDSSTMGRSKSFGGVSVLSSPYTPVEDEMSILTSPHSVHDHQEDQNKNSRDYHAFGEVGAEMEAERTPSPPTHIEVPVNATITTSPSSRRASTSTRKMSSQATHEPEDSFLNEAGALFLMHQSRMEGGGDAAVGMRAMPRRVPMPMSSDEEDDSESDDDSEEHKKAAESVNTAPNIPGKKPFKKKVGKRLTFRY